MLGMTEEAPDPPDLAGAFFFLLSGVVFLPLSRGGSATLTEKPHFLVFEVSSCGTKFIWPNCPDRVHVWPNRTMFNVSFGDLSFWSTVTFRRVYLSQLLPVSCTCDGSTVTTPFFLVTTKEPEGQQPHVCNLHTFTPSDPLEVFTISFSVSPSGSSSEFSESEFLRRRRSRISEVAGLNPPFDFWDVSRESWALSWQQPKAAMSKSVERRETRAMTAVYWFWQVTTTNQTANHNSRWNEIYSDTWFRQRWCISPRIASSIARKNYETDFQRKKSYQRQKWKRVTGWIFRTIEFTYHWEMERHWNHRG